MDTKTDLTNSKYARITCDASTMWNLLSRSFSTFRALLTTSFCLRADARRETWESGSTRRAGIVTAGILSIMLSRSGNDEKRREQKKRGVAGKPCVCVSAHLDFRPIGPAKSPLISFVLRLSRVKPLRIESAKSIDRRHIRSTNVSETYLDRV